MATGTYVLEVDWNDDGDWGDTAEDVTANTMECVWSRGRDYASQLSGRASAGSLAARLDNSTGIYSSFNTSSSLTGNLLPGRKVRLRSTDPAAKTLWTGFLDTLEPVTSLSGAHNVVLRASGPLARINRARVRIAMTTATATGAIVTAILNATNWPVGDRTIDTGLTTIERFFSGGPFSAGERPALYTLRLVEETEFGYIGEAPDGKIVFEDRHHRLTQATSKTSQATYTDASDGTLVYSQIQQLDPLREIYNRIEAEVRHYVTGSVAVLWTLSETGSDSPSIEPGDTQVFIARFPNPVSATNAVGVNAWTTPASTTDYTANAAADGSGTNMTSDIGIAQVKYDESMKITLTNNGAVSAYITKLQSRGTPVTLSDPIRVQAEDATSQTAFDVRTWPNPGQFLPSSSEAQDYCDFVLSTFKDPTPTVKVLLHANRNDAHLTEVMTRDVSERVTITGTNDADLGINEDFFIESMTHRLDNQLNHTTIYECSSVADFSGGWVLNTSRLNSDAKLMY